MELCPVKTKINHVYTFEEPLYNKLYVPMCLKTCAHVLSMWALPPEVMNKAKKAFFFVSSYCDLKSGIEKRFFS